MSEPACDIEGCRDPGRWRAKWIGAWRAGSYIEDHCLLCDAHREAFERARGRLLTRET